MNRSRYRRLSIARELATWGTEMPALMARSDKALKMANLPGRQKLDLEVLSRRITRSFDQIGETPDAEADDAALYDQLIENTDRLRELIAATNAALDRVVKGPRG
jgi:hypothetical protein